jgi:molecular chaperone DnaK (HSP70)
LRKAEPAGPTRTPEQLTTDYLTALIKHLRYILGQKLGTAVLRSVPLEFVLTVPAGWTERANGKTLAACQQAGLDTKSSVSLVSEPVSHLSSKSAVNTVLTCDPGSRCSLCSSKP